MHPRNAILAAIRTALAGATSPALTVYEFEQASANAPCWQIADLQEEPDESQTTRGAYSRMLTVAVAAFGTSREQRDELSDTLELALLGPGSVGGFELELESVALTPPGDAGERVYPAIYNLRVQYFKVR